MKKYYEAYEDRYKTAHEKGVSWSSSQGTPIVLETIRKYKLRCASAQRSLFYASPCQCCWNVPTMCAICSGVSIQPFLSHSRNTL